MSKETGKNCLLIFTYTEEMIMKLYEAIGKNDINEVINLLTNGADCQYAVLIHLKDKLIPAHFTEQALIENRRNYQY